MSLTSHQLSHSERTLATQLQKVAATYGCISPAIIAGSQNISPPRVFLAAFGSWEKAAAAAGVKYSPTAKLVPPEPKYTLAEWREQSDEEVLEHLRKISRKHNGLSRALIDRYARAGSCPGYEALRNRFKFQTCLEFCDKYSFPFIGSRSRTRSTRK